MLGLLRRLHRLQIQSHVQTESCASGIIYPRLHKHKCKSGKNLCIHHSLQEISNIRICEAVKIANDEAKEAVKKLGMEILNLDVNEVYTKKILIQMMTVSTWTSRRRTVILLNMLKRMFACRIQKV